MLIVVVADLGGDFAEAGEDAAAVGAELEAGFADEVGAEVEDDGLLSDTYGVGIGRVLEPPALEKG